MTIPRQIDRVDKRTSEKWYQSRTIQAALISAGVLLFVSIIGWFIAVYINKSNRSPSTLIRTTDANNRQRVDYNSAKQQLLDKDQPLITKKEKRPIEPEEREGDVNRPKSSPITKIPETQIAPEETTGEVNEPEKLEIIKKEEKPIEPEE